MRRAARALLVSTAALALSLPRPARAEEAAPLPPKDMRWSATLGGAADVGSLPRPSTGLAIGFDVRRGGLAARGVTSVFSPRTESTTGASVALLDMLAMICALAPLRPWFDAGACGGAGIGFVHAVRSPGASEAAGTSLRLEGLATARFDFVLSEVWAISLETGTVLDPLRTTVPLVGAGEAGRSSLFAFRGALGLSLRVW